MVMIFQVVTNYFILMVLETDTTEKVSQYSKYDSQTIQLTVIDNEAEKRFKSLHLSAEQQS